MSIITQGLGANTLVTRGYGGDIAYEGEEVFLQSNMKQNILSESRILQMVLFAAVYLTSELLVSRLYKELNFVSFLKEISILLKSEYTDDIELESDIAQDAIFSSKVGQEEKFNSVVAREIHLISSVNLEELLNTDIIEEETILKSTRGGN